MEQTQPMEIDQPIMRKVIDPNNRSGIIMNGDLKGRSFDIVKGNAIVEGKSVNIKDYDVFYKDLALENGNMFEYIRITRNGTFGRELLPNGMIRNYTLPKNIIVTMAPQESVDKTVIEQRRHDSTIDTLSTSESSEYIPVTRKPSTVKLQADSAAKNGSRANHEARKPRMTTEAYQQQQKRKHEDELADVFAQARIDQTRKRERVELPLSQEYDETTEPITEEVEDTSSDTGSIAGYEEPSEETEEITEETSEEGPDYVSAYSDKDRVSVQLESLTREEKILKKDIDSIIKALDYKKVILNNYEYISDPAFAQQVSVMVKNAEKRAHRKLKHGDILVIICAMIMFSNMISRNVILDALFGDKGKSGYLLFKGLVNLPTVLFTNRFTSESNLTLPKNVEERVAKAIDIAIKWLEQYLGTFPDEMMEGVEYTRRSKGNKSLQKAIEPKMYSFKKDQESLESLKDSQTLVDKLVKYGYDRDTVVSAVADEFERLKNETIRAEEEDFERDMFVAKTFGNGIYTMKKIESNINIIEANLHKLKMSNFISKEEDEIPKSLLFDKYLNEWHSSMNNYDLVKRRAHEDIRYVTPSLLRTTFSNAVSLKSSNLEVYNTAMYSSDIRAIFNACKIYINETYQAFEDFVKSNVPNENVVQTIMKHSLLLWKQKILHFYLNKTINAFTSQFTRTHKRTSASREISFKTTQPRQRASSSIFLPKRQKTHSD